jgi:hypothetical protein
MRKLLAIYAVVVMSALIALPVSAPDAVDYVIHFVILFVFGMASFLIGRFTKRTA